MDDTVAVVGAGNWGTTLAKVLAENGRRVLLWARSEPTVREINETRQNSRYLPNVWLPAGVEATTELEPVCRQAQVILLVVPSHGLRKVAYELGQFLTGDQLVVHATKGIEQETFKRMSEVLREETCVRKIGVLTGPNLAHELAERQPAGTLVASRYEEVFTRAYGVLHNNYFRVYHGHDVVGAEVGGAFKNIVALAAGVVDGLKLGDNTKALLLTRGLNEMARLGVAMGAKPLTFAGMAGVGDLMATCSSNRSRNHQVGARLAQGQSLEQIQAEMVMVAEGVRTTRAVYAFAQERRLDLPIVRAVHRMLYEGATLPQVIEELMSIPGGAEFGDWAA
ncbi:MAG: NAD(P)-dependent glycerol-3-phosphate dehydrogenase [Deltaproteobacteria bacterium]|nr:NAD(P)-dependent glycerol-3-phosphate dehydrogenase [Deltaproteobacteria bacterium]